MSKKFSIITVTKNNKSGLLRTLESIKTQSCRDFELIIVDGHSDDGTEQLLFENQDLITFALKDKGAGIYAAMNQGIDKASGEWLIFMNAGDCFYDEAVLQRFPKQLDSCLAYGKTWIQRATETVLHDPPAQFWQRMPTAHQSMFFRKILFEEKKYDTSLDIAADFEFFMFVKRSGAEISNLNTDVALVDGGGISDVQITRRVWQTYRAAIRYFPKCAVHRFYVAKMFWVIIRQLNINKA